MSCYRYDQYDIFQQVFQAPLHRDHELMVLGEHIDWDGITDRLLEYDSRRGRQDKRIRLMVGNLVGVTIRDDSSGDWREIISHYVASFLWPVVWMRIDSPHTLSQVPELSVSNIFSAS